MGNGRGGRGVEGGSVCSSRAEIVRGRSIKVEESWTEFRRLKRVREEWTATGQTDRQADTMHLHKLVSETATTTTITRGTNMRGWHNKVIKIKIGRIFIRNIKYLVGFTKLKDQMLISMTQYIFRVTSPSSGVQYTSVLLKMGL